ncbi:unnamed protein product [Effrenium voratum]|nr:unnamed protein product [Effrenium voratum]
MEAAQGGQGMKVRNTFIDIPSTATPVPSPPASAPARQAVALKESLQNAAEESSDGLVRRKPNPLNFLSQNSMVSIPEDQDGKAQVLGATVNGPLPHDPMKFVSGVSEMPATPSYTWGVLQTPTETPSGFRAFVQGPAYTMPAVATPSGAVVQSRQTLSLQDMIQSPKVETKNALLNNSYQQLYHVQYGPPVSQAPMMGAPLHTLPPGAAPGTPPNSYPPNTYQAPDPPQGYIPMQGPPPGQIYAAPVAQMPQQPPMPGCPSVALGLVHGAQMPPTQPMQPMSTQPMQPMSTQPIQSQPIQSHYGLPPHLAAQAPARPGPGFMAHPGVAHQLPPPPPTFAAPAVVMSPKAVGSAPHSESDIRTLLEVAVSSGNQEAINAVMRQAQMAGMKGLASPWRRKLADFSRLT